MIGSMARARVSGFNREGLIRLRTERGLTQEGLAIMIGVSPMSISAWERGRSAPDPANFARLSAALRDRGGDLVRPVNAARGLIEYRQRAGLSQTQASDRTGIALSTLRMIERGARLPTPDERAAIAKTYKISRGEVKDLTHDLHEYRRRHKGERP